jgi:hypothetical protein
MPAGLKLEIRTTPGIDVAAATAAANADIRNRMEWGAHYITAITDAIHLVAQCIADEALSGEPQHWQPWLDEYVVLGQMRDRCLISFDQEQARLAELRAAAAARTEQCIAAGCTGRHP